MRKRQSLDYQDYPIVRLGRESDTILNMPRGKRAKIDGYFLITHVDQWVQDYLDDDPFIQFSESGGEFEFGSVHGDMDCEDAMRDGKPAIEWSWEGWNEEDYVNGRGWAVLQDDGSLVGKIYFHGGDGSGFKATKKRSG